MNTTASTALFPPSPSCLHLVDLSGYVFRAYHAVAPLHSPTGEPTHAIFGTLAMIDRLLKVRQPKLIAFTLESLVPTFRSEIDAAYKANRPPPPEDLKSQFQRIEQILRLYGFPIFRVDGLEADDIIATMADWGRERGLPVVVVSADKDLLQLVGPTVVQWDTMREQVFGQPEVEAKFGVPPSGLRDLLALTGDSSDNVPGVPSVGPKTAAQLLQEFGSLEQLYERLDEVKRVKLRETLRAHREDAFRSQRLVTLRRNAPLDLSEELLTSRPPAVRELRELLLSLGLQRQAQALGAEEPIAASSGPVAEPREERPGDSAAAATSWVELPSAEALQEFLASPDYGALTSLLPVADGTGLVAGLLLATTGPTVGWFPCTPGPLPLAAAAALRGLLATPPPCLAVADLKQLLHLVAPLLAEESLPPLGLGLVDVGVAGYLLDAGGRQDLAALVATYLNENWTPPTMEMVTSSALPIAWSKAAQQLAQLGAVLQRSLSEHHLDQLWQKLELPLVALLTQLECRGVLVDGELLRSLSVQFHHELKALEQRAHEIAGKSFNVNAPRQLETLLFDDLGLKPLKRTKTARSTDAETLETLADKHPLPQLILEIRQLAKLQSTYLETLPGLIVPATGRVHTTWEQKVAATGRLASADPNLQNIPIRTEQGRAIRRAFVAPPGHLLVSADYSQIELRVLAHLSQDATLIEAFQQGEDIHARTAREIFHLTADAVTPEHRRRAKAVNFGVVYGQGEQGLAKSLHISRGEARDFIAAYYERYAGVRRFFQEETLGLAREVGYVVTLHGRRRPVPEIDSRNPMRRAAAERIAMNHPIQGTAADLLKLAMLRLATPPTPGTRMILTVHDELVFEVPESEVDEAKKRIAEFMETVATLAVPLRVDVGAGPSWADAH